MIYKRGNRYSVKFKFGGRVIRRSTKATDPRTARQIEGEIRSQLAKGEWGILERKEAPTLEEFLTERFLPYTERVVKPSTLRYYKYGVQLLLRAGLGGKSMERFTNLDGVNVASFLQLSPSTVNAALRTLYRTLRVAEEWGVTGRAQRIRLLGGERQRRRVLSRREKSLYLRSCKQPWRDIAIIILETGMRPGEVFALRREDVQNDLLNIPDGKSENAQRSLPITRRMWGVLMRRRDSGEWIFPANNKDGHVNRDSVKKLHQEALKRSRIKPFVPYTLRHTALTELGNIGVDPFTIMKIAGHSSISTTSRYIHPQESEIRRAFGRRGSQMVGTFSKQGL